MQAILTGVLLVLTAAQPRPTCENRSLKATALTEHGCPVSVITVLAVYGFLRSRQTSEARALGLARVKSQQVRGRGVTNERQARTLEAVCLPTGHSGRGVGGP